ncbi:MAG: S41 family peptidase [Candidatus Euphemobacter frigidus]|nr:S41 family peptidase [Candidatus Euphemobacter frigidus]MDP8275676.1 S41 family peptidase [Candidatus Euphemobacter frigidus]
MNLTCRLKIYLVAVAALFLLPLAAFSGEEKNAGSAEPEATPARSVYENLELFTRVMEIVNEKYVDDINRQKLIYGALQGMMKSLDDYSQFMEPDIYKEMKVETKGEFGGIGIEITLRDGILTIISPIEDTPASRVGLHPGDKIVKIEGESTKDITLMEAVKKLRGKPSEEVTITILRHGERKFLDFTIVRDKIKIESVKETRMLNDEIGYIRLVRFQENTMKEFNEALEELEEAGIKALVLDLRWNPGGLLSSAISVADRFLKEGQLIVETRGRDGEVEMEARATGREVLPNLPMAILINKGSASGSEIVAGALRDNYRAVLVGETSFGKGSVQSVVPLSNDETPPGIRFTTGRYYTAGYRAIQDKGIEPDVIVEMTIEEQGDFFKKKYKALEEIEKKAKEAEVVGDLPEEVELGLPGDEEKEGEEEGGEEVFDPQLQTAVDILKGILIQKKFDQGTGL